MKFTRRQFLKAGLVSGISTVAAGAGGLAYASYIEPAWLDIHPVDLSLPRLSPAFDGYKLVQFSDIHMGTGMTRDQLTHIVAAVNAQSPDLVAITGDFVTHGSLERLAPALIEPLSQLEAKDGSVAVLGNHDHWTDPAGVRQILRESAIRDVSNGVFTLVRDDARLHVAGVDDHWEALDRLDEVLAQVPDDGAAILLAHEPDFADISAPTGRFDLQISGHSHGGQIILPFLGPPRIPRLARKYPLGQYQVGTMIQYTNRGVGTILPSIRFNCRPEITVFTLHAAA